MPTHCETVREVTPKTRQANFELLRIICMLMIVSSHFISHDSIMQRLEPGTLQCYLVWTAKGFYRVSVGCFVMLNGYFMCEKTLTLKKIVGTWAVVFFYSAGICLLCYAAGLEPFSKIQLLRNLLPISTRRYWFLTVYMLLLVMMPLLNAAIGAMTQGQHLLFLLGYTAVFSVLPSLTGWAGDFADINGGQSLLWFIELYMVAAYIRKYTSPPAKGHRWPYFCGYVGFALLMSISIMVLYRAYQSALAPITDVWAFYYQNSIIVLASSVCFFRWFQSVQIKSAWLSKIALKLGPMTVAVYLIHYHTVLFRWLWDERINPGRFVDSWKLWPYQWVCVAVIFLVCCLIEAVRQKLWSLLGLDRLIAWGCDGLERRGRERLERFVRESQS